MGHNNVQQLTPSFPTPLSPARQCASQRRRRLQRHRVSRCRAGFVLATTLLLPSTVAANEVVQTYPPSPALMVDMQGLEDVGGGQHAFTTPFLPPLSTSRDHRIGLMRKATNGSARFHLITPEQLDAPFLEGGNGPTILAPQTVAQDVPISHFFGGTGSISHFALCDAAGDLDAVPPVPGNPFNCGGPDDGNDNDCYNLHVIAGVLSGSPPQLRIYSTPVEIEVEHPKQFDDADPLNPIVGNILGINVLAGQMVGPPLVGLPHPNGNPNNRLVGGIPTFHTPLLAGPDNQLLMVRFGFGSYFAWNETATSSEGHEGSYDPVYAVRPANSANHPCDPNNWTNFKPLSFAPQDPEVNADFDFAKLAFRQPDGERVNAQGTSAAAVKDIPGRYLWLDQAGKNVFFASLSQPVIDHSQACANDPQACQQLYPIACTDHPSCPGATTPGSEGTAPHQGWMMMGAWTRGKMVLLDNQVNHTDFGLRAEEKHHRLVTLYNDPDPNDPNGIPVAVQVGAGRENLGFTGEPYGWIDTTVQFGSTEHFLNLHPNMVPRTPRDVVWPISGISHSDEMAFDDLVSQRTLIFSPMNAVKDMNSGSGSTYHDGVDGPEMRLQNAATSTLLPTPRYGTVVSPSATEGRIEHVALGGIKGRGFYLYPQTRIDYEIEDGTGLANKEWLVSIFIDPRAVPTWIRRLITLPSGAYVDLHGVRKIRLCASIGGCTSLDLAKPMVPGAWSHLAFHLKPGTGGGAPTVDLYQDGFWFAEITNPSQGFTLEQGWVRVGAPNSLSSTREGTAGWIDEFKVIEGPFSPEEICNHARGTLVAVPHDYRANAPTCPAGTTCLADLLAPFERPNDGQTVIHRALYGTTAIADGTADQYLCQIDYTRHLGVSIHDPGDVAARSLRRRLLFPEGPLFWSESRPDSVANPFCLACHEDASPVDGLTTAALTLDSATEAHADDRRQPMQPPKYMEGLVPAGYFGDFKPLTSRDGATETIDRYIDDGALFRWTFNEGAGTTASNWVLGRPGVTSGDGTVTGATFAPGVEKAGRARGHALDFDGVDDHVRVDQPFDLPGGELTLGAWFKLGVDAATHCRPYENPQFPCTLIAQSGAGTHAWWSIRVFYSVANTRWQTQFKVTPTVGSFESLSGVFDQDPTAPGAQFDANAWHHLAGVYSAEADRMELYLDGELIADRVVTGNGPGIGSGDGVTIGARLNGADAPIHGFKGQLDDVQVFKRRLWDWEIQELVATTP